MATQKKYLSLDKLTKYDEKIKAKINADDAVVLASAKSYADGLAVNYDAAGSATTAETNAKAYADGLAKNYDAAGSAAAVQAKLDEEVTRAKAAEAENKALAEAVQSDVDALETYVGTFTSSDENVKTVVQYIDKKTSGIATDTALAELQGKVTQAEADIDALELKVGSETVAKQIEDAVKVETDRATGVESGFETRIKAIEDDYLVAADKEALEGKIATNASAIERLTNGVSAEEVDGVNDLIQYVKDHGTEVTGMKADITANADAIAAEKTRAEGVEASLQTAVEKAQADATLANTNLAAEITRATEAEGGLDNRLKAVEAKFGEGEGNVESQIAAAKQEAITEAVAQAVAKDTALETVLKKYADDEDAKIEASVAALTEVVDTKAAQADLTTLAGRVTTAESEIDTLQSDLDAAELLISANDAAIKANAQAIALKASQEDLTNLTARVAANEAEIASFVEISDEEINQLF